jgi:hypothetical protein
MDQQEIKTTSVWRLYEQGRDYHRRVGIYSDTDKNYRFYNGDQWKGAKLGDIEPVQKNFILPIVNYKLAVIHDNLYKIVFDSQNFENPAFRKQADRVCKMLNNFARRVEERDKMDKKYRKVTKDAAVNSEGIIHVFFDKDAMYPINEVIKKNDIYYGDENDDDIQDQPYILIRKRMPVANAVEWALSRGLSKKKTDLIIGDNDTFEESGDSAKVELDDKVTIVSKFYKENGTVHYSASTRFVDIVEGVDLGISLYPVAHMTWMDKEGFSRGEGEVKSLIPNQIEVNKTEMRRLMCAKNEAFPIRVINKDRIANPDALNTVGSTLTTKGGTPVDDVNKIVGVIQPSRMSPDVKECQESLIAMSRELAGAGEAATGDINPEQASGRAIVAVQAAQRAPLSTQKENFKAFVEDLARIWLDYLIVHSVDGVNLQESITDPNTGEESIQIVPIPQHMLKEVQAAVKIEVTPASPYDKYATEQTLENILTGGLFHPSKAGELRIYAESLPDDAVAPKQRILEAVTKIEDKQRKIAMIDANARAMEQRVDMFLSSDPDTQAMMASNAIRQKQAQNLQQRQARPNME